MNIVKLQDLKILMVHGSPTNNLFEYVHPATHEHMFNVYLTKYKVDIVVLGHTHIPFIWKGKKGTVLNPGSVGQPRSGNSDARYLLLKEKNGNVEALPRSVSYDLEITAKKIKTAGLPVSLAKRLFRGI
jgi:putative phosphoesterase